MKSLLIIGPMLTAALLCAGLLLGSTSSAYADPIGPNCGSGNCFGSIYTLTSQLLSSGTTTQTYNFTLSVNTAGYIGPGAGLDAVAIKTVPNSSNIISASLLSGPTTFSGLTLGGLNANGCSAGPAGFLCTQSSALAGVPVPNGTYSFVFATTITNGTLLAGPGQASVKALYVDASGKQAGLTSAPITIQRAVPIPETFLLFATGLSGFIAWHRKEQRRSRGRKIVSLTMEPMTLPSI